MEPVTDVRQISDIAYGFMASKALFTGLHLDVFSRLSDRPKTLEELAEEVGVKANRLQALLTACVSLGLLTQQEGRYANAPASQAYLVRGVPAFFGDYYRLQVDRQIYPHLGQLDAAIRGEPIRPFYDKIAADPEEAENFSRAQHAGSLGPALLLARQIDLSGCRRLLDVGGGSGAFSITLCRRYPEMTATILDFPNIAETTKSYIEDAGLQARIQYVAGRAVEMDWPVEQQAVLMSYLLSAVAEHQVGVLLDRAFAALEPGGVVLLHDFMVGNDRTGPTSAALWLMTSVSFNPDCSPLTPSWLSKLLAASGFTDIREQDLIPGITKLVSARKPPTLRV